MNVTLEQVFESIAGLRDDIKEVRHIQSDTNKHLVRLNGSVGSNQRDVNRIYKELGRQAQRVEALSKSDAVHKSEYDRLLSCIDQLTAQSSGNRERLFKLSLEVAKLTAMMGILAKLLEVV